MIPAKFDADRTRGFRVFGVENGKIEKKVFDIGVRNDIKKRQFWKVDKSGFGGKKVWARGVKSRLKLYIFWIKRRIRAEGWNYDTY